MTRSFQVLLAILVLTATAGWTPLDAMQEEPDSAFRIEPILVRVLSSTIGTATPYPVSVIAGRELTRGTAPAFLDDAVRAVPGLQIHNRYNLAVGERISIRGSGARSQFGVRGIRVLVDGIPATLPDGQATVDHLDLAGLGRVEALRGPAAAAYGNAAGGVLHFRTLDPAIAPASVSARSAVGSHGLWTVESSATGTSGETGYRVGVSRMTYDGFRRNPIADDGSTYGAGTRSILNGTVSTPLAGGTLRIVANGMDLDAENPGSLPQATLDEGERAAWGFNVISGATKQVRQGQLGTAWTGTAGANEMELALWGVRRELSNPIPGTVIALNRDAGGVRGLLHGVSPMNDATFQWRLGAEAELQRDDRQNYDNDGGEPAELTLDQNESVRGVGVFVQGRLDTGSTFSVLAGLRLDNVRFSVTDHYLVGGDPDDSGERSMSALSPSIGAVFAATENIELFGSVSRAFETPTTTELANREGGSGGFNPLLDPQTSVTFEAGARGRFFDRVAGEATLFTTEFENGLVPFEVASDPGRTYYRNSGRSRHMGWEVSADGSVVPDVSFRIAYTRIDAEYLAYETETESYEGNKVPGLAPRRLDGVLGFTPGVAFVELRGLWEDDVPVDDAGSASSPSHFVADVRAGVDGLRFGNVEMSPFAGVSNIFDERYNSSVVPNAFGSRYFEPGPGRTYRLGLGVTWGG